ncbi:MAG: copper chaperone PCu(A)C [SAR324 cluster bacterium]|nr:copper chaperone PCu(A)C [SAR324 cluster bacterium]
MFLSRAGILAAFLLLLTVTQAGAIAPGNSVMADNPRVVLRSPGATTGEVFLTLRSLSRIPTRLISVLTNAATKVEIHGPPGPGNHGPSGSGIDSPSAPGSPGPPIDGLKVPPGAVVKFAPDGFRIVLQGIAPPLKAGDVVVLALVFDTVPGIIVRAPVSIGPSE